ncbi:MAG: glycoside hydrolase family 3 N-terminal domain-containing protein, partial [Clostridiales bacterium]|nr:glycoside hydrolase family 3 N-terminal domain-containing protein [Clostridiales bacterium]
PAGKLDRPYQELAAFTKTKELNPGESCEVILSFQTTDLSAYDETNASYLLEAGEYVIRVGNSSHNTHICGVLSMNQSQVTRRLRNICVGDKVEEVKPVVTPFTYAKDKEERKNASVIPIDTSKMVAEQPSYSEVPEELKAQEKFSWKEVKAGTRTVEDFASTLSNEELGNLCIGAYSKVKRAENIIGAAAFTVAGAAGETTNQLDESYEFESLVMADGPAGVRLSPSYKIINGQAKSSTIAFGENFEDLLEPEELVVMKPAQPSKEEQEATEYYQYCTAIPIGTELAQSFNLDLAKSLGDLVGEEMEMLGIHLWLAPALNIHRSPLCGRNFEYYSEDPLLSGLMAATITMGVQQHKGCATTIKHFACNNQETNRYTSNSIISERALREIYLRGFEICVKMSQPHTLMTSYNLINGEHACNSKDLQTFVLRDEWGYKGFVMTDWMVTADVMKGPGSKHDKAYAAGCVKAGNDMVMPGGVYDLEDMMKALEDESHPYPLTRAELQVSAIRILRKIKELRG